jgi:hypothetical protein
MNKDKFIEWLKTIQNHYFDLSILMFNQSEEDDNYVEAELEAKKGYGHQHRGKTKFIDLILLKIQKGDFND